MKRISFNGKLIFSIQILDNDFESAKCDELCDALKDYVSSKSSRSDLCFIENFNFLSLSLSIFYCQQPGLAFCTKLIQ